jgi:hypothetical protein
MDNYDLCQTFPEAQFCNIKVIFAGQPIVQLAQCVSKSCSSADLTDKFSDLMAGVLQTFTLVSQLTATEDAPKRGEESAQLDLPMASLSGSEAGAQRTFPELPYSPFRSHFQLQKKEGTEATAMVQLVHIMAVHRLFKSLLAVERNRRWSWTV